MYRQRKWFLTFNNARHKAARMMQQLWMRYRFRNIMPIYRRKRQNNAATLIQKLAKGFLVYSQYGQ